MSKFSHSFFVDVIFAFEALHLLYTRSKHAKIMFTLQL